MCKTKLKHFALFLEIELQRLIFVYISIKNKRKIITSPFSLVMQWCWMKFNKDGRFRNKNGCRWRHWTWWILNIWWQENPKNKSLEITAKLLILIISFIFTWFWRLRNSLFQKVKRKMSASLFQWSLILFLYCGVTFN